MTEKELKEAFAKVDKDMEKSKPTKILDSLDFNIIRPLGLGICMYITLRVVIENEVNPLLGMLACSLIGLLIHSINNLTYYHNEEKGIGSEIKRELLILIALEKQEQRIVKLEKKIRDKHED